MFNSYSSISNRHFLNTLLIFCGGFWLRNSGIMPNRHDIIFMILQAVNPQNRVDTSGVGLSVVKKIVETEGSTINLEAETEKRTMFYFSLNHTL
jgi:light-regulated signal transduction histidine kinase (bacteriophytochrome)